MKFGIVGTGLIAQVHAAAIAAIHGCILHSVCGRNQEAARSLAAAHDARAFENLEAFLADPELEIVTICTPSGAHSEPALAALRHGKHVLEFENGARGVIEASTCCASQAGHPVRIQLCGTGGSVFLADESFEVWDFLSPAEGDARIRADLMVGAFPGLGANNPAAIGFLQHQRNFEEVLRAIRDGREPSTSAREARKAVALIEAIYRSARNGGARTEPVPVTVAN